MKTDPASAVTTYFAPAERADKEEFHKLKEMAAHDPLVQTILKAVGGFVLVLNEYRQIVSVSPELLQYLNDHQGKKADALRPGELFDCVHVPEGPGGCGTSPYCHQCGAVLAILASLDENRVADKECLMLSRTDNGVEAREFRVHTVPLPLRDRKFVVFVLHDISSLKRKEVMESLFFHDLGNILSSLLIWSESYRRISNPEKAISKIAVIAKQLENEIANQRTLLLAESNRLKMRLSAVEVFDLFGKLEWMFETQATGGRALKFEVLDRNASLQTDETLLSRVLANMVKNALEASGEGDIVKVSFFRKDDCPCFTVHNPSYIPGEIALQVFKRSFSTKAPSGRGLGTYSMKLFGENYLKGEVSFTTSEADGTVFKISLPKSYPAE